MAELTVVKVLLQYDRNVVQARQRARELAEMLGFERQDQVRLATATSELARNAFRYARDGAVEFAIGAGEPQRLIIRVSDAGPGIPHLDDVLQGTYRSMTGMGRGLTGTRRLMDHFEIATSATGTTVTVSRPRPAGVLPLDAGQVRTLAAKLMSTAADPFQEVERQNQELLRTMADLREKQEQLAEVNRELEDTNRGVVALYAELESNAADLRRVSDLKTSFLSNLSHEFRTPLNSILALCGILQDRADGELSPEQEKQVGYIRRSAADLSELVNDLLDLAKVEAGKVDIRPHTFTVEELFGALRGMLRGLLTSKAVDLYFVAPDSLPALFTDEAKVSQILRNLISNALKFTERGSVTVSATVAGERVVFRVADTGIGIAPEDRERIFEEFVQVAGDLQSRVRGTGLGLPLSQTMARLLGGSLVLAESSLAGSTFEVELPVQFTERPPASAASPGGLRDTPGVLAVHNAPQTRLREEARRAVLLVDDDEIHRYVLRETLEPHALEVVEARSGRDAVQLVTERRFAAVFLDQAMPGLTGLETLRELRSAGATVPVVLHSSTELSADETGRARALGAVVFGKGELAEPEAAERLALLLSEVGA